MSIPGIDVSDYQSIASFHEIKDSGIEFVIAKATEGVGDTQATFSNYRDRTREVGMVFGAYHFLSWNSDPVAQANHFLSVYTPTKGDLPPTVDCEACTIDANAAVDLVAKFIQTVEAKLNGQKMLLYMSYSFPGDHLNGGSGFAGHDLWVAAYQGSPASDPANVTPDAWKGGPGRVIMHQWSDGAGQAAVPGLGASVDRDVFFGSSDDLKALTLK